MTDLLPPTQPTAVATLAGQVEWTDSEAAAQARRHAPRELGRLAEVAEWLAETQGVWPPHPPAAAVLVLPRGVDAAVRAVAEQAGVTVHEFDGPDRADATDTTDASDTEHLSADAAVAAGGAAADACVDAGADLLLLATGSSAAVDVAAGVLVGLYTGAEPVALLPRGAQAVDTEGWIERAELLRDARRTAAGLRGAPDRLLATAGSPEVAVAVGVLLRAAARRVPVVLDGAGAAGAAMLVQDVAPRAARWCRLADTSPDPVQTRAADELGHRPLLDFAGRGGDGRAATLCVPVLRTLATLCTGAGA